MNAHVGEAQHNLADVLAEFGGLPQGGSLREVRPHPDRSFVHVGQEFETHARYDPHPHDGQDAQRRRDHQPATGDQSAQHHRIHGADQGQQPVLRFLVASAEHDRRQDRHDEDRKQKCPGQGKDHRQRHRAEQQSLDARQRQQGHIGHHDHQHREEHRSLDLQRGSQHHLENIRAARPGASPRPAGGRCFPPR